MGLTMTHEEASKYMSAAYIYGGTTREEHDQVTVAHYASKIETAPGEWYGLIGSNEPIEFLAAKQLIPAPVVEEPAP